MEPTAREPDSHLACFIMVNTKKHSIIDGKAQ